MTFKDLGISKKIGLLVVVMGISSLIIAGISGGGLYGLQKAMTSVGEQEEVAREAMDLRVDIIAISRMTYQLAAAPDKAADCKAETEPIGLCGVEGIEHALELRFEATTVFAWARRNSLQPGPSRRGAGNGCTTCPT